MTTEPTSNRSDSDLEMRAMLYALGDPSLDREAFESLMESDSEAMEAVSRAVWVIQGVISSRATHGASHAAVSASTPARAPRSAWGQAAWVAGALAIAASLVAFFSLGKPVSDSDFSSEWTAIASAWTDVQGSEVRGLDPFAPRELSASALDSDDFSLVSGNDSDENQSPDVEDIPSWLITAASRAQHATDGTLQ
jgi:hypothetical protein